MIGIGARKGRKNIITPIATDEDRALRAAFGRYAQSAARSDGVAVVRKYQTSGSGFWFYCDCRGEPHFPELGSYHGPILVPVGETHIRRQHYDDDDSLHADDCDFFRYPAEQRAVTESYRYPADDENYRLVRSLRDDIYAKKGVVDGVSHVRHRSALARIMARLVTDAGLQVFDTEIGEIDLTEQYRAIRAAAAQIRIRPDIPLGSVFHTHASSLPEFYQKLVTLPKRTFGHYLPHGLLLLTARAVDSGLIRVAGGASLPVKGRISIFGEVEGHGRTSDIFARRPPYLVMALAGQIHADDPISLLKAYVHPVASPARLMMLDSDFERKTLHELQGVATWLRDKRGVRMTIEKPQFDITPSGTHNSGQGSGPEIGPPCIPDFVVKVHSGSRSGAIVVETMGYPNPRYRERKANVHPRMSDLVGGPVVFHDFYEPEDLSQDLRDERMRKQVIRLVLDALGHAYPVDSHRRRVSGNATQEIPRTGEQKGIICRILLDRG